MVSVTNTMRGCRIASSTMRSYHLKTRMYNVYPPSLSRGRQKPKDEECYPSKSGITCRRGSTRPPSSSGRRATARTRHRRRPARGGRRGSQPPRLSGSAPEVEPGEADQEHDENSRDGHGPSRPPPLPVSQNEREHSVEADGDGSVAARERIEGGVVAGVEELGTRPLEYAFQDGGEHGTPSGRDQEEYGGELPASLVEERYDHDQEQQHE